MTRFSLAFSVLMAMVASLLAFTGATRAQPAGEAPPAAQPAKTPEGSEGTDEPVYVKMATSMGDIILELDKAKAPVSVENFLRYVDAKYYDGTVFHRVIRDFMIQGGGFDTELKQKKTEATIKNEWKNGLKNVRGSIAMARLGGRADSATSQFFINVKDNPGLDQPNDGAGYAVFGKVVEGMETVDKIRNVKTGAEKTLSTLQPGKDGFAPMKSKEVPEETVTVQAVTRLSADEAKDLKSRLSDSSSEAKPKDDGKTDPAPAPKR